MPRLPHRPASELGQTAAEYMGMLLVVAVIVGVIASPKITGPIRDAFGGQTSELATEKEADGGSSDGGKKSKGDRSKTKPDRVAADALGKAFVACVAGGKGLTLCADAASVFEDAGGPAEFAARLARIEAELRKAKPGSRQRAALEKQRDRAAAASRAADAFADCKGTKECAAAARTLDRRRKAAGET